MTKNNKEIKTINFNTLLEYIDLYNEYIPNNKLETVDKELMYKIFKFGYLDNPQYSPDDYYITINNEGIFAIHETDFEKENWGDDIIINKDNKEKIENILSNYPLVEKISLSEYQSTIDKRIENILVSFNVINIRLKDKSTKISQKFYEILDSEKIVESADFNNTALITKDNFNKLLFLKLKKSFISGIKADIIDKEIKFDKYNDFSDYDSDDYDDIKDDSSFDEGKVTILEVSNESIVEKTYKTDFNVLLQTKLPNLFTIKFHIPALEKFSDSEVINNIYSKEIYYSFKILTFDNYSFYIFNYEGNYSIVKKYNYGDNEKYEKIQDINFDNINLDEILNIIATYIVSNGRYKLDANEDYELDI